MGKTISNSSRALGSILEGHWILPHRRILEELCVVFFVRNFHFYSASPVLKRALHSYLYLKFQFLHDNF